MISVCFQGKPFNIKIIQVYAPTSNAEGIEVEQFYSIPTRPSRINTPKRCPFHFKGLECKSRKSRIPGVAGKFCFGIKNEAGQSLTEFFKENPLVIANILFQEHKRRLHTWTSPDGQY